MEIQEHDNNEKNNDEPQQGRSDENAFSAKKIASSPINIFLAVIVAIITVGAVVMVIKMAGLAWTMHQHSTKAIQQNGTTHQ